jgi:hypothetical protein
MPVFHMGEQTILLFYPGHLVPISKVDPRNLGITGLYDCIARPAYPGSDHRLVFFYIYLVNVLLTRHQARKFEVFQYKIHLTYRLLQQIRIHLSVE